MDKDLFFIDRYHLTTCDFDAYDRIRPFAIFDYFQVVAGHHAYNLNFGYHDLLKINKIWVLLRCKYDLIKQPKVADVIKVATWPIPKRKVEFERQYLILDENDNEIIKGTSIWCLVDLNSKMISRDPLDFGGNYYEKNNYLQPLSKIPTLNVTKEDFVYAHQVRIGDLDHNHHMNNAKYSELVLNALDLKENEIIEGVDISFINESRKNDLLNIYKMAFDEGYYIIGFNKDLISFKAIVKIF